MAIESQTQQPDQGNETDQSQTQNRRSRRASSIVTAPNMVAAPLDSRVSMSGQPVVKACKRPAEPSSEQESVASVGSVKSKGKSKNKKKSQSKKGKKQKSTSGAAESKKKKDEYAHPTEYFHDGVWEEGDELGTALNFKCKWCHETYRGQKLSNGNLKTHRDGSTQAHKNPNGCVNREHAKRSGILLPPSVAETRALEAKDQGDNTQKLLPFKPAFVNRVLNQLVMLWQIRQALPWTRIKDPFLRAAFQFANLKAVLYGRRWSADESKKLYSVLKSHVFEELNNLDTKFTLIHDVWTTKGNRFAFIGAAVAYIDQQWEYVVRHLTLRMIPWKHAGHLLARPIAAILKKNKLYTKMNSGSNNNTMASAMYELIHGGNTSETADELEWDPTTMHVRCICHKFALIVNAGLAALDLKTLPPAKAKESVLGFFPVLGRLTEVEEPDSALPPFNPNQGNVDGIQEIEVVNVEEEYSEGDYRNADNEGLDVGAESDGGYSDSHTSEIVKVNSSDGKHVRSSKLLALTTKLDVVIKQITQSAAQRANFDRIAHQLGLRVAPLIAGYGIRWNIKFQSYKKAVDARDVIDQILKEDQESNEAGDFGDVLFSPREWKEIDNLNQELEVFVELTSQMEGNSATGAHVIPKYLELKESLTAKLLQAQMQDSLYPMYHAMLKRVERYLDEAMRCNTLVIATVMHPCYRMHLFELAFGPESTEVTKCLSLLDREFQRVKQTQQQPTDPDPDITVIKRPPGLVPTSLMERLATRMVQKATLQGNEIEAYLNANISFEKGAIDHKTTPLKWWKANHLLYPTLAVLARAYLAVPGSSCAVERLFSAASDVCSSRRGSLLPSTMSHCVSSLMWLREDVLLDGDFEEAGKALKGLIPTKK
ncbi:hypothetical protein PSHT_04527 [Puccinia striiformis]|uniref:HAT C-terminal dimerisation domain-containing protein n=1 Tax=Puccinia striiformis TaxID=27350 RepID=A0A2S4WCK8_9BASI|nr:hypothetical protein PSHT_04527 [Puccinia striiformis]